MPCILGLLITCNGNQNTASPRPSGGAGRGDDGPVGSRLGADGLLDEAGEAVADAPGGAAVEPEHVLVEGGRQGVGADSAMMGAQEPALGEGGAEVDAGQPKGRVAPRGAGIDRLVRVALGRQAGVTGPAVGGDRGGRGGRPPQGTPPGPGRGGGA